ncbi:MAG: SusC/RagA family TonB-linked outer membrane protein, partial [Tannerellaceae bacterium]|nr:SusC/RagA family TonB-linked outer membrane protein [Tannerellaceae bacterium]
QSVIYIDMAEDTQTLDEVVVIGYGSAKSKDLTSPIATVSGDELSRHISASPMQSLQGKVPGVQIINSGQPGSSPKVRIRGVGSYDDEKQGPLYVVDGMFFDNIDFLSNSDVETMNVLKDASAAAIYGVRAANGVIIITTKKGALNQRPQITYDGYVGFQTASNRMKMANSEQYATMMREMGDQKFIEILNSSIEQYGGSNGIPATNTNWYDELLRTAVMHSHSININGGSENISYVVGANYLSQDGIMAVVDNGYERFNARSKVDIKLSNFLKVGANLIMTNSAQNLAPEDAWRFAFLSPSIYPVHDQNNSMASAEKFASPMQIGFDEYFGNPVAVAYYYHHQKRNFQVLPSFYAEFSFLDNKLTYRSSFNQDVRFQRERQYTPAYNVSNNQKSDNSVLKKTHDYYNNYIIDNIITYRDAIGKNNFTVTAGSSVRKERWEKLYGTANDVPGGDEAYWYLMQGANDSRRAEDDGYEYRGASWFGRLMYDYDSRYLLSATFRADGSSKYQEKWGYFPSVGLGWNITREEFMQNQRILNYLKIRGSWGKLGNDKVEANDGFASVVQDLGTTGIFNDTPVLGVTNLGYFNYLKWEVVTEANIGFDFAVLDNRLSGEFDYYKRTTSNAVFRYPLSFGAGQLLTNNGKIENSGFELTLNWTDRLPNDFAYNIGFNLSTLKNKVTYLNGLDYINTGSAEFRTVRMLGEAVDSYLGYKVIGVYQNQAQVDADPVAVKNGLQPGDFIYKDINGDGEITDEDRVILGSALPKLTLGGVISDSNTKTLISTLYTRPNSETKSLTRKEV